ncbi:MAG TPA: NAD(P)/FAD-dependent oxidoreductase [Gemmataceae bacterium]|nr:NAD(P)/FAD-dependent oxidoreductase [Gemmataceae bacterium]
MAEPPTSKPDVTIVGAGLAGTLLACALARAGRRVDVYEKRPDPRRREPEHGRSINLALSVRGIDALREIGVADEVLTASILMRGRMMHSPTGELAFQPYGKDDSQALHAVSRGGLNLQLVEAAARYPSIRLFFEHKCVDLDPDSGKLQFVTNSTQRRVEVAADFIVGADGAYSAVRETLQKHERFNYRQDYLSHGYKELTIPAGAGGIFQMEKHALHIWPRGSFMMIALPNLDGSFTCTLFWPFEGPNSFAALRTPQAIESFFRQQFPDAVPLIPTLAEDFLHHPTGALVTIRCQPWHWGERVVLLGDACHAVVPFLGQGMNAAFEDCTVLFECLASYGARCAALAAYEKLRKNHLDVLADLCIENFLEMRDRVGSRLFVLRKKLGLLLHRLFPKWYIPLYVMIEFTRIPYADALRRARRQSWVVRGVVTVLLIALVLVGILWLR